MMGHSLRLASHAVMAHGIIRRQALRHQATDLG